jgi:hypothetical protein
MPMASDFKDFLCGAIHESNLHRPSIETISTAALNRWVIPRSTRDQHYLQFQRNQILERIDIGNELDTAIDAEEQMGQLAILKI